MRCRRWPDTGTAAGSPCSLRPRLPPVLLAVVAEHLLRRIRRRGVPNPGEPRVRPPHLRRHRRAHPLGEPARPPRRGRLRGRPRRPVRDADLVRHRIRRVVHPDRAGRRTRVVVPPRLRPVGDRSVCVFAAAHTVAADVSDSATYRSGWGASQSWSCSVSPPAPCPVSAAPSLAAAAPSTAPAPKSSTGVTL